MKKEISFLLDNPHLGKEIYITESNKKAFSNCHGTSLFAAKIYTNQRPIYVPENNIRKLIENNYFKPTTELKNSLVIFSDLDDNIVHSAYGISATEIIHQIDWKKPFEKKELQKELDDYFPIMFNFYTLKKSLNISVNDNMIQFEKIYTQ